MTYGYALMLHHLSRKECKMEQTEKTFEATVRLRVHLDAKTMRVVDDPAESAEAIVRDACDLYSEDILRVEDVALKEL